MDMKDIFGAAPMSAWELLTGQGIGFYIPAYQREYSWDDSNIARLFEDFGHGLQMLIQSDKKDAVTFIGALIVIHDTNYQTVHPYVTGQLPSKVLLIIDGQQRLSTLLIVNTLLHEQISIRLEKFRQLSDSSSIANNWLIDRVEVERQQIRKTFEQDMITGEDNYKWYPRVIRAYDDQWAKTSRDAKYNSPIASYLFGYARFSRDNQSDEYKHSLPTSGDSEKHKIIVENYTNIRNWIKKVSSHDLELEIPDTESIINDENFQKALLDEKLPQEVVAELTSTNNSDQGELFTELIYLLFFAKYLNRRVAVTLVTAKSEEYAFDMFEALNTTGTPLTAFETFRPRVISSETLPQYERSKSRQYMQPIEDYLERYTNADTKQKATDRLLIPFALAESGVPLSKRLREQRGYLRQRYEELESLDEQRQFVQHMAHTAIFVKEHWPEKTEDESRLKDIPFPDPDLVMLCMSVLRASQHEITIGPLVRFFSQIRVAQGAEQDQAIEEFEKAIKAMTAFWVLWRSVRRSTGGIDSRYRELMEKGNSNFAIEPFARRKINKTQGTAYKYCSPPTSDNLKMALRSFLAANRPKVQSKDDWIRLAREMPFYQNVPKPITRLIILAATHDTHYDKLSPGLPIVARKDALKMLTLEQWQSNFTIEHIAPKDRNAQGWSADLYDDPDLVHQIGNLTLLPPLENSIIGNDTWECKRLIYSVLSAPTPDELDNYLAEAQSKGIVIKDNRQKLLQNARYLPYVRALSMLNKPWDRDFIKQRSETLLDFAWNKLAPWLDI